MKKRMIILAAAAVIAAGLLTACANQETTNTSAGSSTTAGNSTAGNAEGGAADSADDNGDGTVEAGDNSGVDAADTYDAANQNGDEDPADNDAEGGAPEADVNTYDIDNQSGEEEVVVSDAEMSDTGIVWTGDYQCSSGESVSISLDQDTAMTFIFAQSGINGTADVSGNTAVYHGDDDYQIVFTVSGDDLSVQAATGDGQDAAEATVNGDYTRQQ